jgi:MYXO-CTERM domain-containing protein
MSRACLAALLTLAPTAALAEVAEVAEVAEDDFSPVHLQQLVGLEDFDYDSDWFPMNAPLQLRLIAHAGNSVEISMPGRAAYDWDLKAIQYIGDPGAGTFDVDVGLTLESKIRFDVLGQQWESDIIGPYDYAVISGATYTPYLLFENPDRPLVIEDETDPVTFVSVPVTPDIIIASGHLDIDAYLVLSARLECAQIESAIPASLAPAVITTVEGQIEPLDPGPGPDALNVDGTLVCLLKSEPTVILKPTLVMTILGQDFEIANIEIPVVLPPFDDTIRFNPISLEFPRPPAPPADSEGDGDTDSGSDDGDLPTTGGDDPTTSDPAATTGDTAIDSGDPDDPAGVDDDGCNCRTATPSPLALLLLLALPRRRRP